MATPLIARMLLVAATLTLGAAPALAAWSSDPAVNLAVCTQTDDQETPVIASDGAGGVLTAWCDYRDLATAHLEIFMQSVSAAGVPRWTIDGVNVGARLSDEFSPVMVADGAGGAIVVWQDFRNGNVDLFAQRVNASGAKTWAATGVAITVAAANQLNQRIVADGAGGAIVVWQDVRNGQSDLYAQRINASGVVQWAANGVPVSTVANDSKSGVQAISDGAGGVIAVWSDLRNGGSNQDVYAQRLNGSGVAQWTAGGVPVTNAPGGQSNPQLATDGAGGVIVVWSDYRTGTSTFDQDLYAQRLNSAGVPQWTANGAPVTQAASAQQNQSVCSDGAGGVFVAWEDEREVTPFHVWAQHVDATGAQVWVHDGGKLCTQPAGAPIVTPDGAGGMIVVWQDLRAGDALTRLYGQRDDAAGVGQWGFDGVAVGTSAGNHTQQKVLSTGAGTAIVVWEDDHDQTSFTTNNDVFAQNLNADGTLGPPVTAVAPSAKDASFALGRIEPNPSRGDVHVRLALPDATPATLELFDLAGRRIASREIAGAAGTQAVALPAEGAAPGVYSLVLRQAGRSASTRVVITR